MPDGRYVEGAVCRLERSFVAHFGGDPAESEISRMPSFPFPVNVVSYEHATFPRVRVTDHLFARRTPAAGRPAA